VRTIAGASTGLDVSIRITKTRAAGGAAGFAGPIPLLVFDGSESGDTTRWSSSGP